MTELTREQLVSEIGEEAVAKIEYALDHPEETGRHSRQRGVVDEEPPAT